MLVPLFVLVEVFELVPQLRMDEPGAKISTHVP